MKNLLHTTKGSNGYKKQYRIYGLKPRTLRDILVISTLTATIAFVAMSAKASVEPRLISPLATYDVGESFDNSPITISPDVKEYIKTIFGKDWKVAYAVARCESGLKSKANLKSSVENSIGIFQINIQSDTAKVHYSRIPGNTLEAKKEWLENPYNNTLMAYWIFTKSGWNPWTGFTNNCYLNFL